MAHYHAGLLILLTLVWASSSGAVLRTTEVQDSSVPVVVLSGPVNQADLDAALASCPAGGCNLHLKPGAAVEAHLTIDGNYSGPLTISGPIRGRARYEAGEAVGTWLQPIPSSTPPLGTNNCATAPYYGGPWAVNGNCLDEPYIPAICITEDNPDTGDQFFGVCPRDNEAGLAPDGVVIASIVFDGRSNEQPLRRPADCLAGNHGFDGYVVNDPLATLTTGSTSIPVDGGTRSFLAGSEIQFGAKDINNPRYVVEDDYVGGTGNIILVAGGGLEAGDVPADGDAVPVSPQCDFARGKQITNGGDDQQLLVMVEAGDSHEILGNVFVDTTEFHLGVTSQSGGPALSNIRVADNSFLDCGCHESDAGGDCGADWKLAVNQLEQAGNQPLIGIAARKTSGFCITAFNKTTDLLIEDNDFGYSTKYALQVGTFNEGADGSCAADAPTRPVIRDNASNSHMTLTGACEGKLHGNTVTNVVISGETTFGGVAQGITVNGHCSDCEVYDNTISNTQGVALESSSAGRDTWVDNNRITDGCAGGGAPCSAPVSVKIVDHGQTSTLFSRNSIDVGNGKGTYAILVDGNGVDVGDPEYQGHQGDKITLALNRIHGGADSELAYAIRIQEISGADIRHNVLDWDTDVSSGVVEIANTDTAAGGVILQTDAYHETPDAGSGYTGDGNGNRVITPTGDTYTDCAASVGGVPPAGCYNTYEIVSIGDTQGMASALGTGGLDAVIFDEGIEALLDQRDAFQLDRAIGLADEADERRNIKAIMHVGDIVNQYTQTEAMDYLATIFARLNDGVRSSMGIPWLFAVGNHDCFGVDQGAAGNTYDCTNLTSRLGSLPAGAAFNRNEFRPSTAGSPNDTTTYDDEADIGMAIRIKPWAQWTQFITLPYGVSHFSPSWRGWYEARVAEFPNDYRFHIEHSFAADETLPDGDGDCDATGFQGTKDWLLNENGLGMTDGGGSFAGFGLYLSTSGHATPGTSPPPGWFCSKGQDLFGTGERFIFSGVNFQQRTNEGRPGGSQWMAYYRHEPDTDNISGYLYNHAGNGGAGEFGSLEKTFWDWDEQIDLVTRGGAGDP